MTRTEEVADQILAVFKAENVGPGTPVSTAHLYAVVAEIHVLPAEFAAAVDWLCHDDRKLATLSNAGASLSLTGQGYARSRSL